MYQWCSSTFASVLFCLPGPRDQRPLGTIVLSRSSPSSLLLALSTARAIRVTGGLMRFTRIQFYVRVVLTLVTSLAIDTSSVTTLWSVLDTRSLLTQLSRVTEWHTCDIDDPFSLLSLWELSRIVTVTKTIWSMCCAIVKLHGLLAQLNHKHLSSQHGTTTLLSMYWIYVLTSQWRSPLLNCKHSSLLLNCTSTT